MIHAYCGGAVMVEVAAEDKKSYQILYITEDT